MLRPIVILLIASLAIVPLGAAAAPSPAANAAWRWGLDHARYAGGGELAGHLQGAIACPLGDVNADGAADLLLRAHTDAGDELRALAGPAHTQVLWAIELAGDTQLTCAPDADLDGIADPVLEQLEAVEGQVPDAPAGVESADAEATLQAIAGATGGSLVEIAALESLRGGGAAAAGGTARTDVALEPGSAGVWIFVESDETSASASLLEGLSLSSGNADVTLSIVDASGELTGVIEAAEGSRILAHAVVGETLATASDAAADAQAEASAKARVLVLSATEASPIDQLPAQVPTIAAHDLDGSVLWSLELAATTDAVMLVPRAGDIDADGVEDLIVQSMPTDVGLDGASAVNVISGADGSVLLERATDGGFLGALPLGDITPELPDDADALLVVSQATEDAEILVECVREGEVCWEAALPADAVPVNGLTDAFTGDLAGFHDLTGDGVPDVAALLESEGETVLRAIGGADGSVAWETAVDAASHVHAVPDLGGADLVVAVAKNGELALTLLDGVDGSAVWSIAADIGSSVKQPDVDVLSAVDEGGDLDALVVTMRDAAGGVDAAEHVYELDPTDGSTTWAGATTDGESAPAPFEIQDRLSPPEGAADVPAPAPVLAALAVLGAAALARMRRAPKG